MKKKGKKEKQKEPTNLDKVDMAITKMQENKFFDHAFYTPWVSSNTGINKSRVEVNGNHVKVFVKNKGDEFSVQEWLYLIVHQNLHRSFGHYNPEKLKMFPGLVTDSGCDGNLVEVYKAACHIYNTGFLEDIKLTGCPLPSRPEWAKNKDELQIYEYILDNPDKFDVDSYMRLVKPYAEMTGIDPYPAFYHSSYEHWFARALEDSVREAINESVNGNDNDDQDTNSAGVMLAREWFISHYPLLGAFASGFKIVEDTKLCEAKDIQVAAVNVDEAIVYINPYYTDDVEELKFIMAHEFLHAGLQHHKRLEGRDPYLWNIACDHVINLWLTEMGVGERPDYVLYDEAYKGKSAETIYDELVKDIKAAMRQNTLRGYGKSDFFGNKSGFGGFHNGVDLDEFYRDALSQGMEFHKNNERGFLPAGLVAEIKALAMPPISWDVKLAKWFELYFPLEEKYRSYSRASRRQGSTPNIPRPRYVDRTNADDARTFGVIVDTSGSMSHELLGKALGSICSYAASREVPLVRLVFCDACAYDAGYVSVDDLAGRVEITGGGGTMLQPAVDLLESAKDFPKDGPILIITDGMIERNLKVKHIHGFLLPGRTRLPFKAKGEVFYMK